MKMKDLIHMVKYIAALTTINNLEKSAQKFVERNTPFIKLTTTLNPPKKTNNPSKTFKCMNNFCLEGINMEIIPKADMGAPIIAGI